MSAKSRQFDAPTGEFVCVLARKDVIVSANDLVWGPNGNLYVASLEGGIIVEYDGTTAQYMHDDHGGGRTEITERSATVASVKIQMRDGTKIEVDDGRHAIVHALVQAIKALGQVARDFLRRRRQAPSPRRKT